MLSLVPISSRVPTLQQRVGALGACRWRSKKVCKLQPTRSRLFWQNLQEVEDPCRLYSAYAWLGYRVPEYFPSVELAQELAREASERVDSLLHAAERGGAQAAGQEGALRSTPAG